MKTKPGSARRRDIKAMEKLKEEGEGETSHSVQLEYQGEKPTIEDLIICQICKDPIEKEHRMCPQWCQIWCYECIKPWFKNKQAQCPNCRKKIKVSSLKKSPLFEKLKELLHISPQPQKTPRGCEVHGQPDDFFCKDWEILCCSKCALLSDNHKNHSFTSLEDIYKIKREAVEILKGNLNDFSKGCQKMLEESNSNIKTSNENLKKSRDLFHQKVKEREEQFWEKFNSLLETETKSKSQIEEFLTVAKNQKIKVIDLLEHPHKEKLVRSHSEVLQETNEVLAKQREAKVAKIIDGDDIQNHFIPQWTTQQWILPVIDNTTEDDGNLNSEEFEVVKDKIRLCAKIIPHKKTKSVQVSLRIETPNAREKQYEVQFYHKNNPLPIGEYVLNIEKETAAESHILHTFQLNSG